MPPCPLRQLRGSCRRAVRRHARRARRGGGRSALRQALHGPSGPVPPAALRPFPDRLPRARRDGPGRRARPSRAPSGSSCWPALLAYALALLLPFANLLWARVIKLFLLGNGRRSSVKPGVYPKWSRVHLRVWCSERLAHSVLSPLGTVIRSAPLLAWALRRLGATVGDNLQCSHDVEFAGPLDLLSIGDDVAIQAGAHVSTCRWVGQELHVGPVHLGSGCKIGMRAGVANDVTVGRGSWITPLTPVLDDVGEEEMWEGAPARRVGRCTELRRTASSCRYRAAVLAPGGAQRPDAARTGRLPLRSCPTAAVAWGTATFFFAGEAQRASLLFEAAPLPDLVWHVGLYAFVTSWITVVLVSVLGCVFLRFTPASSGLYPARGLRGALLLYRMRKLNQIQRLWTWTLTGQYLRALAGVRFTRVGASECDLMVNLVPELAARRLPGVLVQRLVHQHARPGGPVPEAQPARHAGELLRQQQLRRGVRAAPHQFPPGSLDAGRTTSGSGARCGRGSACRSRWRETRP